ncbi:MAG: DUF935 family protein, partial [Parvibaculum sp.]|nr:DUF935 family protein [Parvibaculum sp.]
MVRTRKSSILGPDGQPVEVALLSEEIAAPTPYGVRAIPLDAVASGLTPERLAGLLREATYGQTRAYLTLAMEMEERYLHYASQLQTRKLAFDAIDETVEAPKGVPTKIVDAVHALLEGPSFREACMDLTDGLAKGYAVVEPIWEYQGGYLQPVAYEDRDQRFFDFDPVKLRELRLIQDGLREGEPLTGGKFITHMPRTRTGLPIRRGIARP